MGNSISALLLSPLLGYVGGVFAARGVRVMGQGVVYAQSEVRSLLTDAPAGVADSQLKELYLASTYDPD